jgi:hypothetical protein
MLYQNLAFPNTPNGYYNYDHSIKVLKDPGSNASYFWSCQFWIINGEAAYMGLQTDVGTPGGDIGKGVNVAMWGATNAQPAPNAGIRANTDGSPGRGLYMAYSWEEGTIYRMRVWQVNADSNGFWWGFWVKNESTGVDTWIGNIYVPLRNWIANSSVVWTEYYGPDNTAPCNSPVRKPESVEFLNPSMNNNDNDPGHQTLPVSSSFNTPMCPNYTITTGPSSDPYSCIQSVNLGA